MPPAILILAFAAVAAGCSPTIRLETCPMPDPAVADWQRKITGEVNDHETRLGALENSYGKSTAPTPDK